MTHPWSRPSPSPPEQQPTDVAHHTDSADLHHTPGRDRGGSVRSVRGRSPHAQPTADGNAPAQRVVDAEPQTAVPAAADAAGGRTTAASSCPSSVTLAQGMSGNVAHSPECTVASNRLSCNHAREPRVKLPGSYQEGRSDAGATTHGCLGRRAVRATAAPAGGEPQRGRAYRRSTPAVPPRGETRVPASCAGGKAVIKGDPDGLDPRGRARSSGTSPSNP